MALELHKQCRERLVEKVSEVLGRVKVQNHMFLERRSTVSLFLAEEVLPGTGPLKKRMDQYVSETPLYDFLYETLSRELYEQQEFDSNFPLANLTDLSEYKDTKSVAQRLITDFESLPWKYALTIRVENDFGQLFAQSIKEFQLGDCLTLITPSEGFIQQYPLQSGIEARDRAISGQTSLLGLLGAPKSEEWDKASTYLQIKVSGFIGKYGETTPLEDGISLLKAFCGLAIALRLLKINRKYRTTSPKSKFFLHWNGRTRWEVLDIHELDAGSSEAFNDLIFYDLDGALDTDVKRAAWMREVLNSIHLVISNRESSRRLILAGQWLFDSYCGKNDLLSFVQTAVVLEILLGEKAVSDLLGLGELLRNRCAYLIGKTNKQRQEVLTDFKEIYDVRSKIVHAGKSRLNLHERTLFSKLQWICRRVIQEEVKLLEKDHKSV